MPYRVDAVHHRRGGGRTAAAGLLRRLAGAEPRPDVHPERPERRRLHDVGTRARRTASTPHDSRPGDGSTAQLATKEGFASGRRVLDIDGFRAQAFDLMTTPAAREAFRIDREDPKMREPVRPQHLRSKRLAGASAGRGRGPGRQHLVGARRQRHVGHPRQQLRLAEEHPVAATRRRRLSLFWTTSSRGAASIGRSSSSWASSAAAPKINAAAGRDHWNFGYSLFLAGGGIKAGYVHGASDKIGGTPQLDAVTPAEIIATIYQCLGIPADTILHDQFQRPMTVVPNGQPISDRARLSPSSIL